MNSRLPTSATSHGERNGTVGPGPPSILPTPAFARPRHRLDHRHLEVYRTDGVVARIGDVQHFTRQRHALRIAEARAFRHAVREALVSAADDRLYLAFGVSDQHTVMAGVRDEQPLSDRVGEHLAGVAEQAGARGLHVVHLRPGPERSLSAKDLQHLAD